MSEKIIKVIVDAPMPEPLDYLAPTESDPKIGERVIVPFGRRELVGIVTGFAEKSEFKKLRRITSLIDDVSPVSKAWLRLTYFAARYYQSSWGQVAISSVPKFFKKLPGKRHDASLNRLRKEIKQTVRTEERAPKLNLEQSTIVDEFQTHTGFFPALLFGVTGSGKTEVYLRLIDKVLQSDPKAQVLLMVPEINLTPQLVQRIQNRFFGFQVVTWNSSMPEGEKAASWLSCHEGRATILVGTRLSVFASFQNLKMIIVDEEHDPSFKAQEGVRYNSRDLAIKRAQLESIPIILGSATPSMESYKNALDGRYRLFKLTHRASIGATLPALSLVDIRKDKPVDGLCKQTVEEINQTIESGRQVIVFLNRRGFAPVVECRNCGWESTCPHCSTFAVFHKTTGRLTCHCCGWSLPLPKTCPKCGSYELMPIGRGTQRVEEEFESRWPQARILRLDQDSARLKGSAEEVLSSVHRGEVDILIGTQIVAKGHDFKNVGLVVVLNTDPQLLSSDYRARERLFSVLMQVAGRAGRGEAPGKVLIQTRYAQDMMFKFLEQHDFEGFAQSELESRKVTAMAPYSAQALIVSEGRDIARVMNFLNKIKTLCESFGDPHVRVFDPVPQAIQKVMDVERAQLLVEADDKLQMQKFLTQFRYAALQTGLKGDWYIDVDPLSF